MLATHKALWICFKQKYNQWKLLGQMTVFFPEKDLWLHYFLIKLWYYAYNITIDGLQEIYSCFQKICKKIAKSNYPHCFQL